MREQAPHVLSDLLRQRRVTIFAGLPQPVTGKPLDQSFLSIGAKAAVDVRNSVARFAKPIRVNRHYVRQRLDDATTQPVARNVLAAVVANDMHPGHRLAVLQRDGELAAQRWVPFIRGTPRRNIFDEPAQMCPRVALVGVIPIVHYRSCHPAGDALRR